MVSYSNMVSITNLLAHINRGLEIVLNILDFKYRPLTFVIFPLKLSYFNVKLSLFSSLFVFLLQIFYLVSEFWTPLYIQYLYNYTKCFDKCQNQL